MLSTSHIADHDNFLGRITATSFWPDSDTEGSTELICLRDWSGSSSPGERKRAVDALERGRIVFLPFLSFTLEQRELRFLSASASNGRAKNISYDPRSQILRGTNAAGSDREDLKRLLARFNIQSRALLYALCPSYAAQLEWGRASLRPVSIDARQMSARKDDTRLHVDAFPSEPVQGRRILRVFTNVNQDGAARVWRVGERFAGYAKRFLSQRRRSFPGTSAALALAGITRGRRTEYDELMLMLHDSAKGDITYQQEGVRGEICFPPGSTWIVFSDLVPHAAISGQHALEQTFYLPVSAMCHPEMSPVRILEGLVGRPLTGSIRRNRTTWLRRAQCERSIQST